MLRFQVLFSSRANNNYLQRIFYNFAYEHRQLAKDDAVMFLAHLLSWLEEEIKEDDPDYWSTVLPCTHREWLQTLSNEEYAKALSLSRDKYMCPVCEKRFNKSCSYGPENEESCIKALAKWLSLIHQDDLPLCPFTGCPDCNREMKVFSFQNNMKEERFSVRPKNRMPKTALFSCPSTILFETKEEAKAAWIKAIGRISHKF